MLIQGETGTGKELVARAIYRQRPRALSDRIRGIQKDSLQPMSIAEMEKRLIVLVLRTTDGNRTHAAEILGISREGLRTKMQRYGLSDIATPPM